MKILFTASECVPFVKTGGLADVVGALAPVLAKKGHDVRVVLPLYTAIDSKWQQQMEFQLHFEVQLGWRRQYCGVKFDFMVDRLLRSARGFDTEDLARAVELCAETDYAMKSTGMDGADLLSELLIKIAAGARA